MIEFEIERLISFGICHLGLSPLDKWYARNGLLSLLKVKEPHPAEASSKDVENLTVPDEILEKVFQHALKNNLCKDYEKSNFLTKVMGHVTPMPSSVCEKFASLLAKDPESATDYLYDLQIKNYYIQKTAVDKNIYWKRDFDNGRFLEITINLSKPEKSNAEIAQLLKEKSANYPKCLLCKENEGFEGNLKHAARQTLRSMPIVLGGEDWFLQFSPYVYYPQHTIAFASYHSNMMVDSQTFVRLLDFVKLFPHYFMGSNAALPIVGGSILNHQHFQGGRYKFPVSYSKVTKTYSCDDKSVGIFRTNWYNSVIRLVSVDSESLAKVATKILKTWENYSNDQVEILSHTNGQKHNTLTPICRKEGENFILELILRNNRTNEEHPEGVFHAHKEHHNIKSEGIGLIEAMGMFILPGRLKTQLKGIQEILMGQREFGEDLEIHKTAIEILCEKFGTGLSKIDSEKAVKEYVENTCVEILKNTAVFKECEKGQRAFDDFMAKLNFKEEN